MHAEEDYEFNDVPGGSEFDLDIHYCSGNVAIGDRCLRRSTASVM